MRYCYPVRSPLHASHPFLSLQDTSSYIPVRGGEAEGSLRRLRLAGWQAVFAPSDRQANRFDGERNGTPAYMTEGELGMCQI